VKANHRFAADRSAPMFARRELGRWLRGAVHGERLDDVLVATSELVTNATILGRINGQEELWLEVDLDEEHEVLRVTVGQPIRSHPSRRVRASAPVLFVSTRVLDALTDRWGTSAEAPAMAWFEVDLTDDQATSR
jgi:hypothetical protein